MFRYSSALRRWLLAASAALLLPLAAQAQNVAIVNGKAVPKARVDTLLAQAQRAGQQITPELQGQAREQVVLREIFAQEAERRGIAQSADYKAQMELARQTILIRELFDDYRNKHPVTEADARAEYDKFKAQNSGTEYRARHILVESEDEAKALIAQINGGASFEELAKTKSKDTGSRSEEHTSELQSPLNLVPEFSKAMVALKKGEMTETPVKSQFGWHIIQLEDTREAQFPEYDAVKPQIEQRLAQLKLQQYQEELRKAAKTDYKFAGE